MEGCREDEERGRHVGRQMDRWRYYIKRVLVSVANFQEEKRCKKALPQKVHF